VTSVKVEEDLGPCTLFDPISLRETGAVAISVVDGQIKTQTARQMAGARLWTNWPDRKD
jgi:competence protein ComEC